MPEHDYTKYQRPHLKATHPTPKDLPEGWEVFMLDMFAEGASVLEILTAVDMKNGKRHMTYAIYKSFKEHNEHFRAVAEYGEMLTEAWWTRRGREKLETKDFNHGMWYMNMKNRFGWRDSIEQKIVSEERKKASRKPIKDEEWQKKYKPQKPTVGRRKQAPKPH